MYNSTMKNILTALTLAIALSASGCTSRTSAGPCIGILDEKVPGVTYKLSGWNLFLAVLFSETIIVPVVVVANELQCPVEP